MSRRAACCRACWAVDMSLAQRSSGPWTEEAVRTREASWAGQAGLCPPCPGEAGTSGPPSPACLPPRPPSSPKLTLRTSASTFLPQFPQRAWTFGSSPPPRRQPPRAEVQNSCTTERGAGTCPPSWGHVELMWPLSRCLGPCPLPLLRASSVLSC